MDGLTVNELVPRSIRLVRGLSEPQRGVPVISRYRLQSDLLVVIEWSYQHSS